MRRLIWVCTVFQLPFYGSLDYDGLNLNSLLISQIPIPFYLDLCLCVITVCLSFLISDLSDVIG